MVFGFAPISLQGETNMPISRGFINLSEMNKQPYAHGVKGIKESLLPYHLLLR